MTLTDELREAGVACDEAYRYEGDLLDFGEMQISLHANELTCYVLRRGDVQVFVPIPDAVIDDLGVVEAFRMSSDVVDIAFERVTQ